MVCCGRRDPCHARHRGGRDGARGEPRHLKKRSEASFRARQRELARQRRGSRNRAKARQRVAARHEKIASRQEDRRPGERALIATEVLAAKKMTAPPHAASQSGRGWARLAQGPHPHREAIPDLLGLRTAGAKTSGAASPSSLRLRDGARPGRERSPGDAELGAQRLWSGAGQVWRDRRSGPVEARNSTSNSCSGGVVHR